MVHVNYSTMYSIMVHENYSTMCSIVVHVNYSTVCGITQLVHVNFVVLCPVNLVRGVAEGFIRLMQAFETFL